MTDRPTHPDPGTTYACPECGSSRFDARQTLTPTYRCRACGHVFDDPAERPGDHGIRRDSTAGRLLGGEDDPADA